MNFKFAPNLFLEVIELNKFKQSLDEEGFRKNIIENTESFGLIQNTKSDPTFLNGKVSRDFDNNLGNKTIKINPLFAIDMNGQFVYQEQKNLIPIPDNNLWYWIKQRHTYSNIELGTFSISTNGNLVGSPVARLTEILRGQPNFPARVRFTNSQFNVLEYDVLEIIDDQNAILQHPALNQEGVAAFVIEQDLKLEVIGTFTPGIAVPADDKRPFQYDSAVFQLIPETTNNTRPDFVEGLEFYLARVRVQGGDVIVQDKRISYWETKGSQRLVNIERRLNPLIGVESIKWDSILTPAYENIVELSWGMRSQNWTIDSSRNLLTLQGSATGGKFKTIDDFTNGDFNGWRVYTDNGNYSKIISSVKQGSAINLTLDVLDVDNYSLNGGISFLGTSWVLVVPDTEEVIIKCIPNREDQQEFMTRELTFPVNTLLAKIPLVVFLNPSCLYTIQYRYKSFKEYTDFRLIPSDTTSGYYTEVSYDNDGNFRQPNDRVKFPYTQSETDGFIELNMSPVAYSRVVDFINKGDLIGVNTINSLGEALYNIRVGTDKNYQHIVGQISIESDVRFNLITTNAVEGNEFRFHFECETLSVGTKSIIFSQEGTGSTESIIKKIERPDVNQMFNQEKGIVLDFVFDGTSWICYQNYDLGTPGEIKTVDGVIDNLFGPNGFGIVRGLFGYALCNGNNQTPNLVDRFIIGAGSVENPVGTRAGEKEVGLTEAQLPEFRVRLFTTDEGAGNSITLFPDRGVRRRAFDISADAYDYDMGAGSADNEPALGVSSKVGSNQKHNNLPPYHALIYCKKIY